MSDKTKRTFEVTYFETDDNGEAQLVTKEFAVKIPDFKILSEANKIRSKVFNESLQTGDLLRDQVDDELRKRGLWNDQRQIEYDTLRKEILDREYKLNKGGIRLSDARILAIEMKEKRERMVEMLSSRSELDNKTCEGKADNERFNFLFANCLVYNDDELTPYYPNGLEEYLLDLNNPVAVRGASEFYYLITGTENLDDKLPENVFLKQYKFVDETYRLVEKETGRLIDSEGRYVDEYGNYIEYNDDDTYYYVDLNGHKLDEETGSYVIDEKKPFLDDDGNPVDEQGEVIKVSKPRKRRTKKTEKQEELSQADA
jgi:hypothetical protein